MNSTNRNAAAEARGVPETDQLEGKVNRENSLTTGPVQGGGRRSRARGDRIRFPDGRLAGVFLSNHKSNSAVDTNARDAAIRALSRDSRGHATGPLGVALDLICGEGER
jgi:hypothetical protein